MIPFDRPKTGFFEGLLQANRKLELEYELATAHGSQAAARVRAAAANFLEGYADFNQLAPETVLRSYSEITRDYMRDIQSFMASGKYPLEADPQQRKISRMDYDLFLILTIMVTPHRCAIMEEIMKTTAAGRPLVIGVGSGIELGFIPSPEGGDAYDLYINPFAREAFPQWKFHEEWYRPSASLYDTVYAIELLEHLAEPYDFIMDCGRSLTRGGRFVATTASDVPQFDHRFNFTSDADFERRVGGLGFELVSKRLIPHEYPLMNIRAKNPSRARNAFYVFRKI